MQTKVNYPKQKFIGNADIGTVFSSGQDLWIKIDKSKVMVIGTGELIPFTDTCQAYPVISLSANL